ncbi:MAG TPA: L-aspartate oxidase [candidate division Zixibacteria bacterium]|jgi:L-aspartate oxidase
MSQRRFRLSHIEEHDCDFLVIGSGIAGLWTALCLAPHGNVLIVTKKDEVESNTNYAQGGIAAVVSSLDSIAQHVEDTLTAGAGLCKPRVVRHVVTEAPAMIRALIDVGVQFSFRRARRSLNNLDVGLEGGHSAARVVHASDLTGREIEAALLRALRSQKSVILLEHHIAIDLLTHNRGSARRCVGAMIFDRQRRVLMRASSPATVLATGGAGQVYRFTTNPRIATGDGVAMAFRAGCRVANMEFVQFHPTRLHVPGSGRFLISEALRGAGGILRNRRGEAFMEHVHPLGDLAPRDIVARAIMAECRRTRSRCAYLDMTHLKAGFIRERFPNIHRRCKQLGLDMTREPIPVLPAAHYMCGGIITDLRGQTDIAGLWAAGEVACTGLHGANRLASNSLLEAMVFAQAASLSAIGIIKRLRKTLPRAPRDVSGMRIGHRSGSSRAWTALRLLMWDRVGILRDGQGLTSAVATLRQLRSRLDSQIRREGFNADALELRNAMLVSMLIAASALKRRESRGLHERLDFPQTDDDNWRHDTILKGPRI